MHKSIEKLKEELIEYLNATLSEEVDIEALLNELDNMGFFIAPASTKYFGCYDGGLCEHTVKIISAMYTLNNALHLNINESSIVKVGLCHELAKSDYYEKTSFNKKVYYEEGSKQDELGRFDWVAEVGYKIKDIATRDVTGCLGFASYLEAKKLGFWFTKEEAVAICNLGYIQNKNDAVQINNIMGNNKLLVLLHMASVAVTYMSFDPEEV